MTRIDQQELRQFLSRIFQIHGVPETEAPIAAEVLVEADLRGVESHGVNNLAMYLDPLKSGGIHPKTELKVLQETPFSATLDAQGGLGLVSAKKAMEFCLKKAEHTGVAAISVRRSHHFGMSAYYAMMALRKNCIGVSLTNNAGVAVLPTNGAEPMFSSNPITVAVPSRKEPAFVMDFATTVSAMSKIYRMVDEGKTEKIPFGLALDENAEPTDDPVKAVHARKHLPLGSSPEMGNHKGYGLAVLVDILTGVLSGGIYGNCATRKNLDEPYLQTSSSHFFAVLNPALFRPMDPFLDDMEDMLQALRQSEKRKEAQRIFTHGEKEYETRKQRMANGIPYNHFMIEKLKFYAETCTVPLKTLEEN